jgi:hypothetical protein
VGPLLPIPRGARFDPHWLNVGTRVEMEHTRDRRVASTIAKHHLLEHPLYYQELIPWEKRLERLPKPALANYDAGDALATFWAVASVASAGACAYHGYKRNESVGWAIWWGLCGAAFPIVSTAIAVAQGFARPR